MRTRENVCLNRWFHSQRSASVRRVGAFAVLSCFGDFPEERAAPCERKPSGVLLLEPCSVVCIVVVAELPFVHDEFSLFQ